MKSPHRTTGTNIPAILLRHGRPDNKKAREAIGGYTNVLNRTVKVKNSTTACQKIKMLDGRCTNHKSIDNPQRLSPRNKQSLDTILAIYRDIGLTTIKPTRITCMV